MSGSRRRSDVDLEIGGRVKARELRFEEVPETKTRFRGAVSGSSESQRRNLPKRAQSGVEYRDVGVEWRASARIEPEEGGQSSGKPPRREDS